MNCQNMRVRGMCIVNLPLTFSVSIGTNFSSFIIFFSNSHNKKWKYYITNRLPLAFTVFIEVRNLKDGNFIKKRLQHKCFPVKYKKSLRIAPILKNIYERLLLIFFDFNSQYLLLPVQRVRLKNIFFTTYHHTKIKGIKELQ